MDMEPLEIGNGNGNGNGNGHANGVADFHDEQGAAEAPDSAESSDVERLATVVESLLFAAGAAVPIARLVEALDGPSRSEVLAAIEALSTGYERDGRGLRGRALAV